MGAIINRDVPPFVTVAGNFAEPKGINSEGLKRRGFDAERITRDQARVPDPVQVGPAAGARRARQLATRAPTNAPDVQAMLDFIERSERSLVR